MLYDVRRKTEAIAALPDISTVKSFESLNERGMRIIS
jgi:hypothetical protein